MKHSRQSGFTIVSAIFILVVLASLGAFMVTISTTQQIGSAMDVQGSRAYQAARSGIEWGVYQVQSYTAGAGNGYRFSYDCPITDSGAQCPNRRSCANASGSFVFAAGAATFNGFTVTVACAATPDPRALGGPTIFTLTATACNQPNPGCPNITNPSNFYVERRLEVTF